MRSSKPFLVCVAASLVVAACSSGPEDSTDDAGYDAAQDSGHSNDAGLSKDTGSDADSGAAKDAGNTSDSGGEPTCDILKSGQELDQGQHLAACKNEGFGTIEIDMQSDGNFVLYQKDVCTIPLWSSGTNGKGGFKTIMQTDGDLVVVNSSGTVVWHSNTGGNPGATLAVQGDGNLVIYTAAGKPIWSTGTWHEAPKNKLWIAQDGATSNSSIQTYWHIVLEMSMNFGRMEANWQYGRALAFGGYKVLGTACSVVQSTGASVSQDSATLQCIENQTGWNIASGDVILYYPQGYGCQNGRNHWNIPVTHSGTSYSVEAGYGFTGAGTQCQEALGSHEVYEASSDAAGADCCNGQDGCPATPNPYGWYSFSMCGSSWWAQTVAPTPATKYSASACTKLQF